MPVRLSLTPPTALFHFCSLQHVLKLHFTLNLVVLLIQSTVGCLLVVGAQQLRWIELRPLNTKDVQSWMPISTALVFVIWTGSKALVSGQAFVERGSTM